jgi:hypothetical protein
VDIVERWSPLSLTGLIEDGFQNQPVRDNGLHLDPRSWQTGGAIPHVGTAFLVFRTAIPDSGTAIPGIGTAIPGLGIAILSLGIAILKPGTAIPKPRIVKPKPGIAIPSPGITLPASKCPLSARKRRLPPITPARPAPPFCETKPMQRSGVSKRVVGLVDHVAFKRIKMPGFEG